VSTLALSPPRTGRDLIDPDLFARLTTRLANDHPDLAGMAERVIDQTFAFLATAATSAIPLRPSRTVDYGWHIALMYTRDYADFCQRAAGRFLDHVPDDDPARDKPVNACDLGTTVVAMRQAGYELDADLWSHAADCNGTCSQCYQGCHNDPREV
jgi:hypothetical protein